MLENNSQVEAYVNSAVDGSNGRWGVMKVTPALANVGAIKSLVTTAVQVSF